MLIRLFTGKSASIYIRARGLHSFDIHWGKRRFPNTSSILLIGSVSEPISPMTSPNLSLLRVPANLPSQLMDELQNKAILAHKNHAEQVKQTLHNNDTVRDNVKLTEIGPLLKAI